MGLTLSILTSSVVYNVAIKNEEIPEPEMIKNPEMTQSQPIPSESIFSVGNELRSYVCEILESLQRTWANHFILITVTEGRPSWTHYPHVTEGDHRGSGWESEAQENQLVSVEPGCSMVGWSLRPHLTSK